MEWAEIPFLVITANTSETIPPGIPVDEVPIHIAREKALVVKRKINQRIEGRHIEDSKLPIVAADTIVVLGNDIIGKPETRDDAINMLTRISGQHHKVITGVVILKEDKEIGFSDITDVLFYELTKEQIEYYVDKYQPYDKAGSYAIQEWIGVIGIKSVKGDFYNVMGLPVARVVRELEKLEQAPA